MLSTSSHHPDVKCRVPKTSSAWTFLRAREMFAWIFKIGYKMINNVKVKKLSTLSGIFHTVWKVSGENNFQTVWKFLDSFGSLHQCEKFPDSLASFRTVWKVKSLYISFHWFFEDYSLSQNIEYWYILDGFQFLCSDQRRQDAHHLVWVWDWNANPVTSTRESNVPVQKTTLICMIWMTRREILP